MDPAGIDLTTDDVSAPDFPLPHVFVGAHPVLGPDGMPARETENDDPPEGDPSSNDYLIGDWFIPKPSRPLHSTRCAATARRTGEQCRRWAVIGFTKCEKHSGYGRLANLKEYRERVLERARLDLLRTAPYAVEALTELVRDTDINPAVRLKASTEVLDRVGVRGGTEVDVNVTSGDGELSPAEVIRARLDRLAALAVSPAVPSGSSSAPAPAAPFEDGELPGSYPAGESEIVDAEVLDGD